MIWFAAYAVTGATQCLGLLAILRHVRKDIENGNGTPSKRQLIKVVDNDQTLLFIIFTLFFLWPIYDGMWIWLTITDHEDHDKEDDPQDRVPPGYR